MSRQPENDLDIRPVPAVADVVREEAPRVIVILVREEDAYSVIALGGYIVVVSPDDAEIEGPGGCHDGNVWEGPSAVIVRERIDSLQEERMAGNRAHSVVRDAGGECAAYPRGVGEERIKTAIASLRICQYCYC